MELLECLLLLNMPIYLQLGIKESFNWYAERLNAFYELSKIEGIIPALESAHAVAHAMKIAKTMSPNQKILVNLSGRGDKDLDFITEYYGVWFLLQKI